MSNKESQSLAKDAGLVGVSTLASRVLGLVRDIVVSHIFGAGLFTDAFNMAFTIPNTLRQLVAEGSLTIAFLPVFIEVNKKEGPAAARKLVSASLGVFPTLVAILVALGVLLADPITTLFASGFKAIPGKFELTVQLTRWLFPYLWCTAMVALSMGILNSLRRFFAPAIAPALFNLTIIIVTVGYCSFFSKEIMALVAGVLAGGVLQVILQIVALKRAAMLPKPTWAFSPEIKKILLLMAPTLVGTSIYELNIMLQRYLASYLEQGSVTYLYNADRFTQLPLGVFGVAIASAALPRLADYAAEQNFSEFKKLLSYALRLANFIIIPSCLALVVLARPIISTVFQHGAFDAVMAQKTAVALLCFTLGLGAVAQNRMSTQAFFALKDTKTPVLCSGLSLAVYITSALFLMHRLSYAGLALSLGIASWMQFLALQILLYRRVGFLPWGQILFSGLKSLFAAAVMSVGLYFGAMLGNWEVGTSWWNIMILSVLVGGGVIIFVVVAYLLRCDELADVLSVLARKLPPFRRLLNKFNAAK